MGGRTPFAIRTSEETNRLGYPVVAVNDGIPDELRRILESRGVILVDGGVGMGPGRRLAFAEAERLYPGSAKGWTEFEKYDLIKDFHYGFTPVLNGDADMTVMARTEAGWESYPAGQKYIEKFCNHTMYRALGRYLDIWFSPKVIGPGALPYFLNYQDEYGGQWDAGYIPMIRIIAAGLLVISVMTDYTNPLEQTLAEDDLQAVMRRRDQMNNILPSCIEEAKKLGLIRD